MTQTWLADDVAGGDRLTYQPVKCIACSQQHFVCAETGRVLGERDEPAPPRRGAAIQPRRPDKNERATGCG